MAMTHEGLSVRRIHALWFCSGLAVLLSAQSAAASDMYDVLRSFPFGSDLGSLGHETADTETINARLIDVDETAKAFILDGLNQRVIIVGANDSSLAFIGPSTDAKDAPVATAATGAGRTIVAFRRESGPLLRLYDSSGLLLRERVAPSAFVAGKTQSGNVLVETNDGHGLIEFSPNLEEIAQYADTRAASPLIRRIGSGRVLQWQGTCWFVPPAILADPFSMVRRGNALRYVAGTSLVEVGVNSVAVWQPPSDSYLFPDAPPGSINPELYKDAAARVIWLQASLVGGDGTFYGFVETTDHYDLIRWNLDKLPKTTYPLPANQPPIMDSVTSQHIKEGKELKLVIGVRDPEGRNLLSVAADGVPKSAQFVPQYGKGKAALVWTPTQADVGQYTVTIRAEDDLCARSSGSFQIIVEP